MSICGVYKIESPTGKVYIGSSKNIVARWRRYKNLECKKQSKIYNSLLKHGAENHAFKILVQCTFDELFEYEHLYSLYYDSVRNGLNCQIPSFKEVKAITSNETKEKISQSNKGKKLSQETRTKLSKAKMGQPSWNKGLKYSQERLDSVRSHRKPVSEETKLKMSISAKNKKLSLEHKQKISNSLKGNKRALGLVHNEETKKKVSETHKNRKQDSEHIKKRIGSRLKTLNNTIRYDKI